MKRNILVSTVVILGECMLNFGKNAAIEAFPLAISQRFYHPINDAIQHVKHKNGWFTEAEVRASFSYWGKQLTSDKLSDWIAQYPAVQKKQSVGLILAGNIPLVGFHDVLATLISGHKAVIKLSSDDDVLIPFLMDILVFIIPEMVTKIKIVDKLGKVDAVIATGSDNTARYFEKYFGHLPHVIRKNRTSLAVIDGTETTEDLQLLGKDIFTYFGLGCRNVSHILFPEGYDLNRFFTAIVDFGAVINHHKYANNYDYYKAIYLLNGEKIIENGFLLMKESKDLFTPLAVLHYHFYKNQEEIITYIEKYQEKIQVVVGKSYLSFGETQTPHLYDYADGVDTLRFLCEL